MHVGMRWKVEEGPKIQMASLHLSDSRPLDVTLPELTNLHGCARVVDSVEDKVKNRSQYDFGSNNDSWCAKV